MDLEMIMLSDVTQTFNVCVYVYIWENEQDLGYGK